MAYKTLLVVLDEDRRSSERLTLAATLAERFDAHLVGLYASIGPEPPGRFDRFNTYGPVLRPIYEGVEAWIREQGEAMRAGFEAVVKRQSISAEWRMASGYPAHQVALHGRGADLIILGQIDGSDPWSSLLHPAPQEVALTSGRPILVVPYIGHFEQIGRHVLIGWDASREASRALSDAMPLLAAASTVTVTTIDAEEACAKDAVPDTDIALYLARHGVKASIERTVSAGVDVGNLLLSRASDLDADLLVMGAYGHARVRELLLGGATRTVLATTPVPVLMSH